MRRFYSHFTLRKVKNGLYVTNCERFAFIQKGQYEWMIGHKQNELHVMPFQTLTGAALWLDNNYPK